MWTLALSISCAVLASMTLRASEADPEGALFTDLPPAVTLTNIHAGQFLTVINGTEWKIWGVDQCHRTPPGPLDDFAGAGGSTCIHVRPDTTSVHVILKGQGLRAQREIWGIVRDDEHILFPGEFGFRRAGVWVRLKQPRPPHDRFWSNPDVIPSSMSVERHVLQR